MIQKWKNHAEAYLFVTPSVILTVTLGIYPILWALRYMFYDYKGYGEASFSGLYNFKRLFRDEYLWDAIWNTFVFASGKMILTLPVALLLAVLLNGKLRGRNFLRGIYFMPTIFSTAVMAVVFYLIFNSYNGLLNQILNMIGVPAVEWLNMQNAMLTCIIIAAWGGIGNYMLLFLAGLQGIPKDVYESAELDGATGARRFWSITVPMLGPVLNIIMMLAIMSALESYEAIMVLTGGGPSGATEVMHLYLYKLLFPVSTGETMSQDIGYGSAVAMLLALIVGAITGLYLYLSRKLNDIYS
ncbi:carbohydrate ABC transporter permease [Paenibacillus harenae]|uniref:Raffinose/stachyose/melibiose transport system permease protein n=1 Tax=Paenibacillus harenae TaxID=306543 RepID=A0ABT9UC27_PAEHA|nr:sugar ABC transporter permease [Paenibacillus harenae]MDQ0116787.1 raffinose/stachyose/melibiose transport system permease protein [Paenibacillus harenae]